jgi:hypothetical protein
MTIMEAISAVDALKPNAFDQQEKVAWLSRLDAKVKRLVIDTHEGGEQVTFVPYDRNTDPSTKLLVEHPFDEIYLRWLEMQIDYATGEIDRYNNSAELYNDAWKAFRNYYNQNHRPIGKTMRYF